MSTKSAVTTLEAISGTCSVLAMPAALWAIIAGAYGDANFCAVAVVLAAALAITYKVTENKSIQLRRSLSSADQYKAGI